MKKILYYLIFLGLLAIAIHVYIINQAPTTPPNKSNTEKLGTKQPTLRSNITGKSVEIDNKNNSIDTSKIQIADISIPLLWGDEIEEEVRGVIVKDISLVYAHMVSHAFYDLPDDGPKFNVNGVPQIAEKVIYFKGDGDYRPKQFENVFGRIVKRKGVDTMVIPSTLIKEYSIAIDRKNRFAKEYQELQEFIKAVNLATRDSPLQLQPDELMYTSDSSITQPNAIPNVVRTFSEVSLREPSILEYHEIPEANQQNGAPTLLAASYILREGTHIPDAEQVLVYHQGRWKFLYGREE
jgi:hypothetical protein